MSEPALILPRAALAGGPGAASGSALAAGRGGSAGRGWTLALFSACLALAAAPLFVAANPPLFDYPSHLARVDIMRRLAGDPFLQAYYALPSVLLPNVLSDLVLWGLMELVSPRMAGKILLLLTFALTLGGVLALNRAVAGRWSPWPLLAALFLANELVFWGFLNYNLGIAILPFALAAWVALDEAPTPARWTVGALFGILIFLAHLVAFGLYAVAIGVLELVRSVRHRHETFSTVSLRLLISATIFVPALALYWGVSPASGLPLDLRFAFDAWSKWSPYSRLLSSGNPWMDTPVLEAAVAVALIGVLTGRAGLSLRLLAVAFVFAILVRILPYAALGSFFLDSRIVVAIAFMLCAAITPRRTGPVAAGAASLAVIGLLAFRSAVIAADWREQDKAYDAVLAAFAQLPERALLVAGSGEEFELGDWVNTRYRKPPYEHAAAYAAIDRHALVPNVFAKPGQNPLEYRPDSAALAPLGDNPIRRVTDADDMRALVDAAAAAAADHGPSPPFSGVYAIVYYKTCDAWPADLGVAPIACGPDFSLVRIPPRELASAPAASPPDGESRP